MLKAVVIDDEPAARRAIVLLLERYPELSMVGQAGSVAEGMELIARVAPDVVFLDVEMMGQSGFALVGQLIDRPDIVIVSAHSQHAVRAFDVEAVDFLSKPVHPSRFASTVRRLLKRRRRPEAERPPTRLAGPATLRIPTHRGLRFIEPLRLAAVLAERDYARLLLSGEGAILAGRPIGDLAADLPTPPFLRLSRSIILNLVCILRIEVEGRDRARVYLRDIQKPIDLGRSAGLVLRRALKQL